ncbi:CusA/CzcA family heavy metal efflux RND transporter [Sesbania bispinosa]|nr:CusA/CzcA family heavy metal efflux RND transporter [Sesbania bispinosa]
MAMPLNLAMVDCKQCPWQMPRWESRGNVVVEADVEVNDVGSKVDVVREEDRSHIHIVIGGFRRCSEEVTSELGNMFKLSYLSVDPHL